jgi:hypothetical protein
LRAALDKADEANKVLESEIEARTVEERKLGRIRRVYRNVVKHAALVQSIVALGDLMPLPENAATDLNKHLNDDAHAQTRLQALNEQIETLRHERAALNYDEALLARSADIGRLHEMRIKVRAGKSDLPKRRAQLATEQTTLRELAVELDWHHVDGGQIIAKLPARSKVANARALSRRHVEIVSAEESARRACAEADERVAALTGEIKDEGQAADTSTLNAAISIVRAAGDINTRIALAEKEIKAADDSAANVIKTLRPPVSGMIDIVSLKVPQKRAVEHYRDQQRDIVQRLQTCRGQI